jgi:UDP-glucose 4-epimerase
MAGGGDAHHSAPPADRGALIMRALVTGAAGFIGSTLVDRLLADGYQVVGVDNLRTGIAANLEPALAGNALSPRRFTFLRRDIQAPELTDIVAGVNPEVIFHLAAQSDLEVSMSDPQFDARNNVLGTINLCEASRQAGVQRIVYAAAGDSRYGDQTGPPVDEQSPVDPLSPHAVGKLAGEMYLRAYAEMYGLAPICLALANVYGPRQSPHGVAGGIAVLGSAMVTGQPYAIYRDNTAVRDYVYVDDVVDAFLRAGCAPMETTGTYNIATGRQTTMTEVHDLMAAALDGSPLAGAVADPGDAATAIALDVTKAARELDWKPQVELADGIGRTMRWLCATLEPESPALVGA